MAQESLTQTTTLNQLAELDRYNHWIFERISHALGHRILEGGLSLIAIAQKVNERT
jgi:hypothetical protein